MFFLICVSDCQRLHLRLAIVGEVFDVTPGERHYAAGKNYENLVGRDASKAFISGDFLNDQTPSLDGVVREKWIQVWRC